MQVKGQLDLMRRACSELEGCDDFVTLLQEVLQTGNRLNEGTMRGAAAGAPPFLTAVYSDPTAARRDTLHLQTQASARDTVFDKR